MFHVPFLQGRTKLCSQWSPNGAINENRGRNKKNSILSNDDETDGHRSRRNKLLRSYTVYSHVSDEDVLGVCGAEPGKIKREDRNQPVIYLLSSLFLRSKWEQTSCIIHVMQCIDYAFDGTMHMSCNDGWWDGVCRKCMYLWRVHIFQDFKLSGIGEEHSF